MNWNKLSYPVIALCVLLIAVIFLIRGGSEQPDNTAVATSTATVADDGFAANQSFPSLNLPLDYFPESTIIGGNASTTDSTDAYADTDAYIDSQDDYQSYPTTTISFTDYENESEPVSSVIDPSVYEVGTTSTFAMEGNGSQETVDILCNIGSADGLCGTAVIVKGNTVIFEADSDDVDILPSPTGNGFYVDSENQTVLPCEACQNGYIKTRFVYQNGSFVPIYEQTVYNLQVHNTADERQ